MSFLHNQIREMWWKKTSAAHCLSVVFLPADKIDQKREGEGGKGRDPPMNDKIQLQRERENGQR